MNRAFRLLALGALSAALVASCSQRRTVTRGPGDPVVSLEFRVAKDSAFPGSREAAVPDMPAPVYLAPEVLITNRDVQHVAVEKGEVGYDILLVFTQSAASRLTTATSANVGHRVAIILDDKVSLAPRIGAAFGERATISGPYFTMEDALVVAKGLAP